LSTLMRASLAGDERAYREFLSDMAGVLRRYYARRLGGEGARDAEDLVQETLMALHTRRATYDPDRPVTVWAHAIARYKLVDYFRSRRVRATVPLEGQAEFLAGPDDVEPAMAKRDVVRLLDTLPPRSRRLVEDMKLEGRSVAETAARTGLSEAAVKVGVHRALKMLGRRFGGRGDRGPDE
jgi:RNA polymerase sigma-70 factor (ECF subfamily)